MLSLCQDNQHRQRIFRQSHDTRLFLKKMANYYLAASTYDLHNNDNYIVTSVWDKEIFVTPSFELWIQLPSMFVARIFERGMKMFCIFGVEIIGGEVGSSPKPPFSPTFSLDFKIPVVEVYRRHIWISGMDHAAYPQGVKRKRVPLQLFPPKTIKKFS